MKLDRILATALLAASLLGCGKNQVIGDRHEDDGDPLTADDEDPGADGDDQPGDGDGDDDGGDDDGMPPLPEGLPECRGMLNGENSCQVCCIVDGDILEWCEDLECTACQQDGLEIEPGATASVGCNVCTCNRDGGISCTTNDCAIDCDADPAACTWRTGRAVDVSYSRGDGYGVHDNPLWGAWVQKPDAAAEQYLTEEQRLELQEVLADPGIRDFVRNGDGPCPAIDNYWSQLRSERPPVSTSGSISMAIYPETGTETVHQTRMLPADCTVTALAPLSDFIDRIAQ